MPCLYRVHERPDPASVARLAAQLAALDVPTPPLPEPMSPAQAAELMGEISRRVGMRALYHSCESVTLAKENHAWIDVP